MFFVHLESDRLFVGGGCCGGVAVKNKQKTHPNLRWKSRRDRDRNRAGARNGDRDEDRYRDRKR